MRWRGGPGSRNVIDRRGGRRAAAGGIGGVGALAVVLIGWFFGVDLTPLLHLLDDGGGPRTEASGGPVDAVDAERGEFVANVLGYTEVVWEREFREQLGRDYDPPELVLFTGRTETGGCGFGAAATGPFYCPADERAYLDTSFFDTLDRRLGAGGDFAMAYVVAHEVGHHIQHELGILEQVRRVQGTASPAEANALQVRVELMADCLSGIWAREVGDRYGVLEHGDLDEALNAAAQIGDDTLAREAGRTVRPETFTHGTSEQRQRWFATGYETGSIEACDTFSADRI